MNKYIKLIAIRIDLDIVGIDFRQYLHWFNPEAIEKIMSYRFIKDQKTAFTSALLKYYYLPAYLNLKPQDIEIYYNEHNKPFLRGFKETPHTAVDFNISHCNDYVIMAITNCGHIGVDIEYIDPEVDIEIAPIVFSNEEQQELLANPDGFFILWAKKEALIKALGTGFMTDDYQETCLNTKSYEHYIATNSHICSMRVFGNYQIAICLNISK